MNIKTEYSIGDKVRFQNPEYEKKSIKTGVIDIIVVDVTKKSVIVSYWIKSRGKNGMDDWFVPKEFIREKVK